MKIYFQKNIHVGMNGESGAIIQTVLMFNNRFALAYTPPWHYGIYLQHWIFNIKRYVDRTNHRVTQLQLFGFQFGYRASKQISK